MPATSRLALQALTLAELVRIKCKEHCHHGLLTISTRQPPPVFLQYLSGKLAVNLSSGQDIEKNHAMAMTDQQKNLSAWVQTDRMAALGQLTAGIAHELNNPVGYLLSNLRSFEIYLPIFVQYFQSYEKLRLANEEVERQRALAELAQLQQQENLQFLLTDTGSLLQDSLAGLAKIRDLVLDLRRFSHPDLAEPQALTLSALVQSSVRMVKNELKNQIQLHVQAADEPLWLSGRPAALSQVLVNILVNARQAIGPQAGQIWLAYQALSADELELTITDSGPGISPEAMPHLFEPFFTTKEVGAGTGLGLSICHTIVHQHQGQLEAFNVAGAGACFRLRLPRILCPATQSVCAPDSGN